MIIKYARELTSNIARFGIKKLIGTGVQQKNYIKIYSPGTLVDGVDTEVIDSWDIQEALLRCQQIGQQQDLRPYAFKFITQLEHEPVDAGNDNFLEVTPKEIDCSPLYILNGVVRTYDDIKEGGGEDDWESSILLTNMSYYGWWVVFRIGDLVVYPFKEDMVTIDNNGKIISRGDAPFYIEYRERKNREKDAELYRHYN